MTIFLSLLLVHFVADFFLQRDAWILSKIQKKIRSIGLFKHICVHFILNALILWLLLGTFSSRYFIALFCIVLTHYAIDIWKAYQTFGLKAFLIDQVAHIAILAIVSLYLNQLTIDSIITFAKGALSTKVLATAMGLVFLTKPFSFVVQLSLQNYTKEFAKKEKQSGLGNAGEWIGIMERLLVFVFVLLGQFAGVGFLLAAKSVFRFGDMRLQKDRKLTEYIMLGSLLSIGAAMLVGLLVKAFYT